MSKKHVRQNSFRQRKKKKETRKKKAKENQKGKPKKKQKTKKTKANRRLSTPARISPWESDSRRKTRRKVFRLLKKKGN